MTRWARGALLGGAAAAVAAFACSQVSTDPNSVLALQLDPPVLPSIVLGDSLHKVDGSVDSLHATAYNARGQAVPAPIRFIVVAGRRVASVDSVSGQVTGDSTGLAQVLAYVGGIQTLPQPVNVVLPPDTLAPLDGPSVVLDYNRATLSDTVVPLRVRLLNIVGVDTTGVAPYRVTYAFVPPPANTNLDPAMVQIVNLARVPQLVDTTESGGTSALGLRATLLADTVTDTVYVDVSAFRPDGTPVPGSPVHFAIDLHIH